MRTKKPVEVLKEEYENKLSQERQRADMLAKELIKLREENDSLREQVEELSK